MRRECRERFQRKLLVSDPGMHHDTCVTHVPWCMSGSLTCGEGENVPGIPSACAPAILRIWQEAHYVRQWWPSSLTHMYASPGLSELIGLQELAVRSLCWKYPRPAYKYQREITDRGSNRKLKRLLKKLFQWMADPTAALDKKMCQS